MQKIKLSASLICGDPLNMGDEAYEIYRSDLDSIHFDVMDGVFVPRFGLYPELLESVKKASSTPIFVHMMTENPELYIETYKRAGADGYCIHYETCPQLHRTILKIKEAKMKVGVALNFHTPIQVLKHIIDDIDYVTLMAINPGIVGHKLIPGIYKKIQELKDYLESIGRDEKVKIEIDGGVTFETAPILKSVGADILVCGTGTVFRPKEDTIVNKTLQLRKVLGE